MSILDRPQLFPVVLGRRFRQLNRMLRSGLTSLTGYTGYIPEYIEYAPGDLETPDPFVAEEFYRGRYFLAGELVEIGTQSPFLVETASRRWRKALHEFGWLKHLAIKRDTLSSNHSQALIEDWIAADTEGDREVAWATGVAARRLICLLRYSDMILQSASDEFYRSFMRVIGTHLRFLKRHGPSAPPGLPRLSAHAALAYAMVCCPGVAMLLAPAIERLDQELETQILADGGHISRKPDSIMTVLAILLPYKHVCLSAGRQPSIAVLAAIDRMLPALRSFRLGDGTLARFNGTGIIESELLTTLMRYDDARGEALSNSQHSGYQRLSVGRAIVVMDAGNPPASELSGLAHAGCLSFEFSSSSQCIVVNCGVPAFARESMPPVWRKTAAHSTATVCDTSSCVFEASHPVSGQPDGLILSSNLNIDCRRQETGDAITVTASHLGYAKQFGVRHQRTVVLDEGGNRLRGNDWFSTPDKGDLRYSAHDRVVVRFHLHPDVAVSPDTTVENAFLLDTKSGERWRFTCSEVNPEIEESIFFAHVAGPRRTRQIVLSFDAGMTADVNWAFRKTL